MASLFPRFNFLRVFPNANIGCDNNPIFFLGELPHPVNVIRLCWKPFFQMNYLMVWKNKTI